MRRSRTLLMLAMATVLAPQTLGCRAIEQFSELVESFLGMGETRGPQERRAPVRIPRFAVRSKQVSASPDGRTRLAVDIDVDARLAAVEVESRLDEAVAQYAGDPQWDVVRVTAHPSKLERLGRPMGRAMLARDGRGWQGEPHYRERTLWLGPPPPLTGREVAVLQALERTGATPPERAIDRVARELAIPTDDVRRALDRGRSYLVGPPGEPRKKSGKAGPVR